MSSALESVSYTPDGLDVLGITADIAELFTYLLNVYRYGGDITHGLHSPDGPEQVVLGIDLVGILCKKCKQIEFLGGEDLLFSVYKTLRALLSILMPRTSMVLFSCFLVPAPTRR